MSKAFMQKSFHAGEWAPQLGARVDLAKYHSAAALLRNFFVDYRGGASSRMGTKYVIQARTSNKPVRLISFQASFTVGYILEFGDFYMRPIYNGAPVLEATKTITGITQANPGVVTSAGHGYANDDVVYIVGVVGMTQVNSRFYKIGGVTANTFTLRDLNAANINTTGYTAYSSGGTVARVYSIASPYAAADLALVKFSQNVNTLVMTHPNYLTQILTLTSAVSWAFTTAAFASTIGSPGGIGAATTLAAGNVNYSYTVTAVDGNGQESSAGVPAALAAKQDLRAVLGTNTVTWGAVAGAASYNVYKSEISYAGAVPAGIAYGFIGNATGTSFIDSGIGPDFSSTPPIANDPFTGSGVANVNVTSAGFYGGLPAVTIAPPGAGVQATASLTVQASSIVLASGGSGYAVAEQVTLPYGAVIIVLTVGAGGGAITSFGVLNYGVPTAAVVPNPVSQVGTTHSGVGATFNIGYGVSTVQIINPGSGYGAAPAVSFTPGVPTATATATLGSAGIGNPSAVAFCQQRLVLAAPVLAPQTFYMSVPGSPYNLNYSNPIQPDDSIEAALTSGQLNEIKSMISVPAGLLMLCSNASWLVNGGSPGSIITPIQIASNPQSYGGASDVPPLRINFDVLFVQSKGSIVRDVSYDFYRNVFTGTDISIQSSHLFYSYQITEWAWAEEPFKLAWCVRNDGTLLSLTFMKEQELVGWAHSDTDGVFKSVATVTETVAQGAVDAVYVVVERVINGTAVKYIERMADRFLSGYVTPWCVDSALQYSGTPTTTFRGLEHLAGESVTGLADGAVVPPTVVSGDGVVVLGTAARTVTLGLPFTPQLQTLPVDLGEPTVQGKRKKITGVTVRCQDTLGLDIGGSFSTMVPMKDLVLGNVGTQTNQLVADLVTGDARSIIDPSWTVPGQYCLQQSKPYPVTILGVIPEIVVGDT